MKGYKAFDHGMVCRGKQYAENTTFKEDAAVMCEKGMHFCANPLDCLRYYDLVDDDGNIVEIAEVECADEDAIADKSKTKFVTKKLKINRKLSFDEWVEESRYSMWHSCLVASEYNSRLAASANDSRLVASNEGSRLAASGRMNMLAASGSRSCLAASGNDSRLAAIGSRSSLAASGSYSRLSASGENSIVAAIGARSIAKATVGSWIVLAEWEDGKPKCVKAAMIDGEVLKPDVWYELKDGEIVPVEHN